MQNMNDLEQIKERLTANPFFALSLGSRELFHSNFLAWLLTNYPMMISALAQSLPQRNFKVHREKYSFDLLVSTEDEGDRHSLIVEVKVKDTPKIHQLKQYDETAHKKRKCLGEAPEKLLISLTTAPLGIPASWRVANLAELANSIEDVTSGCNLTPAHHTLVQYYLALCRDLTELVQRITAVDLQSRYFLFKRPEEEAYTKVDDILDKLRFSDTIEKHRASKLCEEIRRKSEGLAFSGFKPHFDHGFDRKQAHVGGAIRIFSDHDKRQPELSLVVSLQGKQYRRMVSFRGQKIPSRAEGKDQEKLVEFIDNTDGWKWMFGRAHEGGFFQSSGTQEGFFKNRQKILTNQKKNKLLLSYAPSYIYQYTDIGQENGVPTDRVIEAVIEDLQYAAQLLSNTDYVARFREWS